MKFVNVITSLINSKIRKSDGSFGVSVVMRTLLICYNHCSSGSISSIVKDVPDRENPSYIQSPPPPISNKTTPALFERASSDVVIKIDEPDTESLLRNGGPDNAYHPSNHGFGYTPKSQLQAHDIAEPQVTYFLYHIYQLYSQSYQMY